MQNNLDSTKDSTNKTKTRAIDLKQQFLDTVIEKLRKDMEEWDEIIYALSQQYEYDDHILEYAFANWFVELIDEIKDEPCWFTNKISEHHFKDTADEFEEEYDY